MNLVAALVSIAKGGGIWLGELEDSGFIFTRKDKQLVRKDKYIKLKVKNRKFPKCTVQ